jgi:hypothetical protein
MRRTRTIALLAVAALIAAVLAPRALAAPAPGASPAAPAKRVVRAGVAVVDATWHVGASAGQYASDRGPMSPIDPNLHATKRAPSYGVQSRLSIRALVVEGSNGERIALVKSDNYLAQDLLLRRVAQLLAVQGSQIDADQILHHVTHNHSSPYYATPAWGVWLFQDVVDLRMFEYQARAMAEAITRAEADLRPARMGATTVTYAAQQRNAPGVGIADDGTPAGYPRYFNDLGLVVLRFDDVSDPARPAPLATWMNYGVHPESLDGYDLISADYLGPLERMVERETGAPLVFSQGGVGSSEPASDASEVLPNGVHRAFSHEGYAQAERAARLMADRVVAAWGAIGRGEAAVPWTSDFPVAARSTWVPGPVSHPYPSVSNCRTEPTVEGNAGAPILGLPDCQRDAPDGPSNTLFESLKAHGIPVPDHYDAPGFTAVEENARLRLQAFRLGDVLLASCACEAQVDLVLDLESRTDKVTGNIWRGYDWSAHCDQQADSTWRCADPRVHDLADRSLVVGDLELRRMRAQVLNDARGWDAPENAIAANSEPADPAAIWGNSTHEELAPPLGYALPVGVGHAGDYNGYTVSYREYMSRDHYRKALTSYGPHTADYMVTRLVRLAGALNGGAPLAPEPLDAVAAADEARQAATAIALGRAAAAAYDGWLATLPDDVGPAAPLAQPSSITRFDAATFTWRGGSNAIDNPRVTVERRDGDRWTTWADQTGEVQTILDLPPDAVGLADTRLGRQTWRWTASFEAFDAFPRDIDPRGPQTPEGTYRFVVEGNIRQAGATAPYRIESQPFAVRPWTGITVRDLRVDAGARSVSFVVDPIVYPRSYASPITFVADDGRNPICRTCTFRPWAARGDVERASVVVTRVFGRTEVVVASLVDGRWVARTRLAPGDRIVVPAGGVVDTYGERNGAPSATIIR